MSITKTYDRQVCNEISLNFDKEMFDNGVNMLINAYKRINTNGAIYFTTPLKFYTSGRPSGLIVEICEPEFMNEDHFKCHYAPSLKSYTYDDLFKKRSKIEGLVDITDFPVDPALKFFTDMDDGII